MTASNSMSALAFLECVGYTQKLRLGKSLGHQMQPDGKAGSVLSARNADRGKAREVRGNREKVVEVHRQRIRGFFAQLKCRGGRNGPHDDVDLLESGIKIVLDEPPHLACALEVRVLIA